MPRAGGGSGGLPPEPGVEEAEYADRMSAADALLWINERDPMLRSTITSLLLLDGPPNLDRFRQVLERGAPVSISLARSNSFPYPSASVEALAQLAEQETLNL